jgi:hypothetical protein
MEGSINKFVTVFALLRVSLFMTSDVSNNY